MDGILELKGRNDRPEAGTSVFRRPPDMSFTRLAKSLQNSWKISRFGQVDWNFHVAVWALDIWGAATVAAAPKPATCRNRRRDCSDSLEVFGADELSFFAASSPTPLYCEGSRYSLIDGASFWRIVQVAADESSGMRNPRESFTFKNYTDATTLNVGAPARRRGPEEGARSSSRNHEPCGLFTFMRDDTYLSGCLGKELRFFFRASPNGASYEKCFHSGCRSRSFRDRCFRPGIIARS